MEALVVFLPGDGIGPEVSAAAGQVLQTVAAKWELPLRIREYPIGGASLAQFQTPITREALEACRRAAAVFLGAVGDPRWDDKPREQKPETALLTLRKALNVYANLRPVKVFPVLSRASALREEVVRGTDFLVVRELTGGIYFGEPRGHTERRGWDTMVYLREEVERIARLAFRLARQRRKKVTSVDKANVLEVSRFWRKVVKQVRRGFPDVTLEHLYVDNAAMQMVQNPHQFDVILTANMFGDILSDIGGAVSGSLGLLPSASIGESVALYEPVHGSAPDIAGRGIANPVAAIASVAMMFTHSFRLPQAGRLIEQAIEKTLNEGYGTPDIAGPGIRTVSTREMTGRILENLQKLWEENTTGAVV